MSRAIDHGTKESVLGGDSVAVYTDIVQALNSNTSSHLLDIELLGKSHPLPPGCNFLLDGSSIAIPKATLIQAFVVARQIFFKCLKDFQEDSSQEIYNATCVILLTDPEHLTAANARKRLIQRHQTRSTAELEVALNREFLIVDSLLTSRLYRHTKSPTLWGHRRWLLDISKSISLPRDIQRDLTGVVLIAAERHPRNYYSWLHMRWLFQTFPSKEDDGSRDSSAKLVEFDHSHIILTVKDWCLRHPADISGWSFLLFALCSTQSSESGEGISKSCICKEVLGLTASFKWTHESVWVFLRTLVASGRGDEDQRRLFMENIEASLAAQPDNSKPQSILRAAHDWCVEFEMRDC